MRRPAFIILATVVLAWAIAAIALDSPSLKLGSESSKATAALSPSCLPSTLDHTAALAGTRVAVSPEPETDTANPHTQISFLGAPAADVTAISVVGARSGTHAGRLVAYSQGDGASFVPGSPFDANERVSVAATIREGARESRVHFRFRTDSPYSTAHTPEFANLPAPAADYSSFATLPGAQPPILSVTTADKDPAAGDILTTNGPGAGQYGPLIYTPQGRLVWFQRLPADETAENLNVQEYEGQRDLTWWRGRVLELGFGQGEDVVMNSRYQTIARLGGGNGLRADLHEFQITPHAVAYITAFNPVRCDLSKVEGVRGGSIIDTSIQEIDMKTGLVRWEWHSLDHIAASESETPAPTDSSPWDWFHINSIDREANGDLLISARNTWAEYQLQAGSGRILWRLGGLKSSFKMGPGTKTAWQHDARMLADGELTIFDDGSNPPIHAQSRALHIALDPTTREARLRVSYIHPTPLLSPSQGNMQTLADSNTVVDYGGLPQISEYSPGGALLFDAHLPYDMSSYRGFRAPWSARPLAPPSVSANLNNTGEEMIVHASWNGSTGVSGWRVLAGNKRASLKPLATIGASGFESSLIATKKYAYAAVQALGASGQPIGSSPIVSVGSYQGSLPGGGK